MANEIERRLNLTALQSADVLRIDIEGFGKHALFNSCRLPGRSKPFPKLLCVRHNFLATDDTCVQLL